MSGCFLFITSHLFGSGISNLFFLWEKNLHSSLINDFKVFLVELWEFVFKALEVKMSFQCDPHLYLSAYLLGKFILVACTFNIKFIFFLYQLFRSF
jgi:hypothetical protein